MQLAGLLKCSLPASNKPETRFATAVYALRRRSLPRSRLHLKQRLAPPAHNSRASNFRNMLIITVIVFVVVHLAAADNLPFDQPLPCMTSPVANVKAGADLIFK